MQQTSIAAYRRTKEFRKTHCNKILEALRKHGKGTCYDISRWTGLDYVGVARRMSELYREMLVVDSNERGLTPSGRSAIVWKIVKKPRKK